MISALAAFYMKISIGHVEAGLRTENPYNPFPEEINRRIISVLADYHFVPTRSAAENLKKEGIPSHRIVLTGNTVIDALLLIDQKIADYSLPLRIDRYNKLILVTAHRRESFGGPLENICEALIEITEKFSDVEIVYPVHPNPNVKNKVKFLLLNKKRIHLVGPLNYIDFLLIMKRAYLILTDSGGVQEEAPTFQKPVLVLRKVTERPEGVEVGVAKVIGTEKKRIVQEVSDLLQNHDAYLRMTLGNNPYGDGKASQRIADFLFTLLR
jgi:UDP-N-acetylglucosamine 2-epimerase (non-hydrolysing)